MDRPSPVPSDAPATKRARTKSRTNWKDGRPAVKDRQRAAQKSTQKNQFSSPRHVVAAVSENLARETCIASIDSLNPLTLTVFKQANGQTFNQTLITLEMISPDEILVNEGRKGSLLAQKIYAFYEEKSRFSDPLPQANDQYEDQDQDQPKKDEVMPTATVVKFVSRGSFDQTRGAELLEKLARPSTYNPEILSDFIIPSSTNAVLRYAQSSIGASFAPHTLRVEYNSTELNGKMNIDRSSIQNLELLSNARNVKGKQSLFTCLNNTVTSVGSHLLRSNLTAPSVSSSTIEARQDLVDSFLGDEILFYDVLELLQRLPDLEMMLGGLVVKPSSVTKKSVTTKTTTMGIASLVCLKTTLQVVPMIAAALEGLVADEEEEKREKELGEMGADDAAVPSDNSSDCSDSSKNVLAKAILGALGAPELKEVLVAVEEIFTSSTAYMKNNHAMRHQECFALRPNTDGIMDVLRKAFLANVDDIYAYAEDLAEECGITVAVKEKAKRGYYLQIPAEFGARLPPVITQPVKSGRFIHCTTDEVFSLNARAQENVQDLLLLTHLRIQEVLDYARKRMDALASMVDAVALLDMIHSFSDTVASSRKPWTRPVVTEGGNLAIRGGRYATDFENVNAGMVATNYVSNDTMAPSGSNFVLITGVNGGGKSTYLKQVALIVILAQIGCFVPAESASIPLRNLICTRIGTGDDFEHNISSFMLEMKEISYICNAVTDKSLILVDELGRATSNEDGVAIAWAVAEKLLNTKAITLFVTHYSGLRRLEDLYPNVANISFGTVDDSNKVVQDFQVVQSACTVASSYGIDMAAVCGWPQTVVSTAHEVREYIIKMIGGDGGVKIDTGLGVEEHAARKRLSVASKSLAVLVESRSTLSEDAVKDWLDGLEKKLEEGDAELLENDVE
ncbi:hypothetical protein TrST_g3702 [Triparma strigata]|uniref:DNA mismatch repair proteins mutS family domain-containing protein n=1 Tax=Triparma strigata TaxID=1606541 RepID=A0A9W6ZRZ6_9STRA|nr:hypothetical protein TrST_g3702 [Triparma strigata]